jgi:hypothetical protein
MAALSVKDVSDRTVISHPGKHITPDSTARWRAKHFGTHRTHRPVGEGKQQSHEKMPRARTPAVERSMTRYERHAALWSFQLRRSSGVRHSRAHSFNRGQCIVAACAALLAQRNDFRSWHSRCFLEFKAAPQVRLQTRRRW